VPQSFTGQHIMLAVKARLIQTGIFLIFYSLLANAQQAPLKVLISADMEGAADVTNWKIDSQPAGRDYAQMRRLMTAEVNAAVTAAFDADASEVIVADSHGDFANLDPEALDPRCNLVRGWPRALGMMQGLTADTAAVVFIGYHAPEGTPNAILATRSPAAWIFASTANRCPRALSTRQ